MHPHVVHNYLKDGNYPTDEATVRLIADKLVFKAGAQRLLDPCYGEGLALAQLATESLCHCWPPSDPQTRRSTGVSGALPVINPGVLSLSVDASA